MLAGTLGALLLLPFALNNTPTAYANIFLIDNFTGDDPAAPGLPGSCDKTLKGPADDTGVSLFSSTSGLLETILGIRECQLFLTLTNNPSEGEMQVAELAGMFRQMSGTGVKTMSYLQYDGLADMVAGPGNTRILNLNLLNSDNLRIQYSFADFEVNVTATLIDGDGDEAELEGKLNTGTNTITDLNFPLGDFVLENPLLNLADIDEINVNFSNNFVATDFDIEFIDITMSMVGGEMFPTDTTALLLAGAELNAIWILPAIAAIGIGAFVVSRKRK